VLHPNARGGQYLLSVFRPCLSTGRRSHATPKHDLSRTPAAATSRHIHGTRNGPHEAGERASAHVTLFAAGLASLCSSPSRRALENANAAFEAAPGASTGDVQLYLRLLVLLDAPDGSSGTRATLSSNTVSRTACRPSSNDVRDETPFDACPEANSPRAGRCLRPSPHTRTRSARRNGPTVAITKNRQEQPFDRCLERAFWAQATLAPLPERRAKPLVNGRTVA
jgi:hypothetical protein